MILQLSVLCRVWVWPHFPKKNKSGGKKFLVTNEVKSNCMNVSLGLCGS